MNFFSLLMAAIKYRKEIGAVVSAAKELIAKYKSDNPGASAPGIGDVIGSVAGIVKNLPTPKPPSQWTKEENEAFWNRGLTNTP